MPGSMTWESSRVFLVALQQLDRDSLRAADEADAHAWAYRGRLAGELDALGLDLGCDRVDVFDRQAEMIEALIGRGGRRVDAVALLDLGDEDIGATELDVDAPGAADDDAAEYILKPRRGRLRIGAAQMDVIPGDDRHGLILPLVCFGQGLDARRPRIGRDAFSGGRDVSGRTAAWPSLRTQSTAAT